MKEIWKDIEGYEGIYQVSNLGRVKTLQRAVPLHRHTRVVPEAIRKDYKINNGYHSVTLSKGHRQYCHALVHRLVAIAFVPGYAEGKEVNHINENKDDNRACNLEWVSRIENMLHGTRMERVNSQFKKVAQYSLTGEYIATFQSTADAGRHVGRNRNNILGAIKRNGTCGGYKWKYIE